jgi:hypothetical protein
VLWTGHPWRVGFQERLDGTKVERAPSATALTLVIARAAALADSAAAPAASGWPDHGNDRAALLIEQDLLDDGVLDAEQPLPYPLGSHAVSSPNGTSLGQPEP